MTAVQKARTRVASATKAGRVRRVRTAVNRAERRTVAAHLRRGEWDAAEGYRVGDISRIIS